MARLTDLQTRCLEIMQRRAVAHDHKGTALNSVAWELGKTNKQAFDCLNRLRRKGLTYLAGQGFWKLTVEGLRHPVPRLVGE